MMVNSFCGEFSSQSHAALHGEFLSLTHPVLGYAGSTSCMAMAMLVYMGSVSYKLHAPVLVYKHGEFLLHAQCWFIWEFLLHAQCCLGVEFLLHIPCWLLSLGSFSHSKVYAGFLM